MKRVILITSVVVAFASAVWAEREMPAFKLKNVDGKYVTFEDCASQYRLMAFVFWGTTCPPCKDELVEINKFAGDYEGFAVVAVATDTARTSSQVKPYFRGQGYAFECLLDVDGELQKGLGVVGVPYSVLVTADGKVVYEHAGYRKGDEKKMKEEIEKWLGAAGSPGGTEGETP